MSGSILIADSPPIPGLAFRRVQDAADYHAIAAVITAGSLADGLDYAPDGDSLRVEYENETDFEPRRDVLLAEVDGRLVAFARAGRVVRDGLSVYGLGGAVHPDWRRQGLGRTLLREMERHARACAAQHSDPGGRALGGWIDEKETGAQELYRSEGYTPVRYYFSMIKRDLDDIPEVPLPHGLEIRAVRPEHHRAIFEADNEAFQDHWGRREQTEEDFRRLFALPDLDTSLWSVAWDGDQIAGSVQTFIWARENETLGVRRGWLEHISVRRPWRRRGVAKALIADAVRRLRAAGMDDAMLGVDADNPTGALQLYEAMGFAAKERGIAFRKPWKPGGQLF